MPEKYILIVEDNAMDEELTLRALRKNGVSNEIIVVRDGQEALDFLFGEGSHAGRDPRSVPELILLDINIPKVNGIDVLARLREDERTRLVPVVILTSSVEERDRMAAYQNHANSYICKPVNFDQFMDSVRQLGLYWLVLNVAPPKPTLGS